MFCRDAIICSRHTAVRLMDVRFRTNVQFPDADVIV